jgi:hypothetical protein
VAGFPSDIAAGVHELILKISLHAASLTSSVGPSLGDTRCSNASEWVVLFAALPATVAAFLPGLSSLYAILPIFDLLLDRLICFDFGALEFCNSLQERFVVASTHD